jgi:hypothetical protein
MSVVALSSSSLLSSSSSASSLAPTPTSASSSSSSSSSSFSFSSSSSFLSSAAPRLGRVHEQSLSASHRDSVQLLTRLSSHLFASASIDGVIVIWLDGRAAERLLVVSY